MVKWCLHKGLWCVQHGEYENAPHVDITTIGDSGRGYSVFLCPGCGGIKRESREVSNYYPCRF